MRFPIPHSLIPNPFLERDRFVLWVPVLLGTGAGGYFALRAEPPFWAPFLALAALLALIVALRGRFAFRLLLAAALIVAIGFTAAQLRTQAVATPVIYGELFFREVQGRVDDIQEREKGKRIILKNVTIERLPEYRFPKRISITLKQAAPPDLRIGDIVRLKATLFAPPAPAMPGGYDFTRALFYDRIGAVGYSVSAPEIVSREPVRGFEERLNTLRLSLASRIVAPMQPENGPVATAMMVGEQSAVSEEVGDAMRDAGLYHVLSISGLHMSLAVALLYVTLRFMLSLYPPFALRWPIKKIAASLGLFGAFAYLLLAGYPVPAVRSFVMVACVMVAVLFDRRGISLYSLAWAASLILLVHPESIFGASFQLSFAATLAIIALYERYGQALYQAHAGLLRKLWLYFIGLMATSLVATLATTPLVIYHFNRFTLWGIVANMLVVPLASFWIMPAAVLAFLAMPFGLEAWPLAWLDAGIGWMIAGSKWVAGFPHASFSVPSPTFWGLLLVIYGALWLCLWRQRWRLLGLPLIIIGLATSALHKPYDVLISDDAGKVAVRLPGNEWLFLRGKTTSFDAEVWLRAHGKEEGLTLSQADQSVAQCDKIKCVVTLGGRRMVVALRNKITEGLCLPDADIVISGDALEGCKAPHLIDRNFLQTSGAVGIRFAGDRVEVETAEEHRGKRPWIARRKSLSKTFNPDMMLKQ